MGNSSGADNSGINGFLVNLNNIPVAVREFNTIAALPQANLEIMKQKNLQIISERAVLQKNMHRFNQSVLSLREKQDK